MKNAALPDPQQTLIMSNVNMSSNISSNMSSNANSNTPWMVHSSFSAPNSIPLAWNANKEEVLVSKWNITN